MKALERSKLISDVRAAVMKRGMPINVRNGGDAEVADWVAGVVLGCSKEDEPLGTVRSDYEYCPVCARVVGSGARYCKWCGAFLRGL